MVEGEAGEIWVVEVSRGLVGEREVEEEEDEGERGGGQADFDKEGDDVREFDGGGGEEGEGFQWLERELECGRRWHFLFLFWKGR